MVTVASWSAGLSAAGDWGAVVASAAATAAARKVFFIPVHVAGSFSRREIKTPVSGAGVENRRGEAVFAVLHQDVRKLALHRCVGRRNEQAEPPPVAARVGMAVGQLR